MKDNNKITLTFGQLKKLINESNGAFWLNNTFNGPTEMTCYDIKWENDKSLPTYIKGIYVPFYGYLEDDNYETRYKYIEAAEDALEGQFHDRPIDFEWQIDDYGK